MTFGQTADLLPQVVEHSVDRLLAHQVGRYLSVLEAELTHALGGDAGGKQALHLGDQSLVHACVESGVDPGVKRLTWNLDAEDSVVDLRR